MKPVNIDPFADIAGRITVQGVGHDVLHLNGEDYRRLSGGLGTMLDGYDIAARIVPTLDVYKLTGAQIGAIIGVADGLVKDVEAQFPNAVGAPATSESQAPPA